MRISTFMKENRIQIVLTPESEYEQKTLEYLHDAKWVSSIYKGQFTDVRGGWTMYSPEGYRGKDNDSTIIVIDKKVEEPQTKGGNK
jgi:hypothetical protein